MDQLARTPKQIGEALRRARRAKQWTQTEAATRAGLRQEQVSKIETGSPGTRIEAICALIGALELEFVVRTRTRASATNIDDLL